MKNYRLASAVSAIAVFVAAFVGSAHGSISAQLTGDPRPGNPDNLIVDVSVTFDPTNDTTAEWLIDINSPLHPDIKLDVFVFNLALDLSSGWESVISFTNFNPSSWTVNSPGDPNGGGFGNIDFNFEAVDPPGQPKVDVTNSQTLSFTATLLDGSFWSDSIFFNAAELTGAAGTGQLGAHLQSLVAGSGESDSGFALGGYEDGDEPAPGVVPEPLSLAVWASLAGLAGVGAWRKQRRAA